MKNNADLRRDLANLLQWVRSYDGKDPDGFLIELIRRLEQITK